MHSQWISSSSGLYDLNKACSFNQFNVHTINNETIAKVKEAANLLSTVDFTDLVEVPPHIVELIQKISIYYAFNERNLAQSLLFLNKLKTLATDTVHQACIDTLIGYANTIDPTYSYTHVFEGALKKFPASIDLTSIKNDDIARIYPFIAKAMAFRYLGLMYHRQAIEMDKIIANLEKDKLNKFDADIKLAMKVRDFTTKSAFDNIRSAIELERSILPYYPLAILSLAESLHIEGVMHIRLGEINKDRNEFEKALALFQEASEKEKSFCEKTERPHFLLATTLQSLAKTQTHLGQYKEAIQNLNAAYLLQVELFNTLVHPDIAKTLHFKGDVFVKQNDYASAVDSYFDTLLARKQIKYRNNFFVDMTINALKSALNQLATVDQELCIEKYKNIHSKLDKDGEFTKYCYEQMKDLRDRISFKAARDQRQFSPTVNRNKEEEKPVVEAKLGLK